MDTRWNTVMELLTQNTAWISSEWKTMTLPDLRVELQETESFIKDIGQQLLALEIDPVTSDHEVAVALRNAMDTCVEAWQHVDLWEPH